METENHRQIITDKQGQVYRKSRGFRVKPIHVSSPGLGGFYQVVRVRALESYLCVNTSNMVNNGGLVSGLITTVKSAFIFNAILFRDMGWRDAQVCEVLFRMWNHACEPLNCPAFPYNLLGGVLDLSCPHRV